MSTINSKKPDVININNNQLESKQKTLSLVKESLEIGSNVSADTSLRSSTRSEYRSQLLPLWCVCFLAMCAMISSVILPLLSTPLVGFVSVIIVPYSIYWAGFMATGIRPPKPPYPEFRSFAKIVTGVLCKSSKRISRNSINSKK